jgi:hypothetical protein
VLFSEGLGDPALVFRAPLAGGGADSVSEGGGADSGWLGARALVAEYFASGENRSGAIAALAATGLCRSLLAPLGPATRFREAGKGA